MQLADKSLSSADWLLLSSRLVGASREHGGPHELSPLQGPEGCVCVCVCVCARVCVWGGTKGREWVAVGVAGSNKAAVLSLLTPQSAPGGPGGPGGAAERWRGGWQRVTYMIHTHPEAFKHIRRHTRTETDVNSQSPECVTYTRQR